MTGKIVKLIAFLLIVLQLFAISVSARENVLSLYKSHPQDGIPFNATNMFPGDCETNVYNIMVSYKLIVLL